MSSAVVVSASYDKQIRLWDAASGRTVKSFAFPESQINSLYLLPDSGYLAVAGFGVLRLYDLATYLHSGGAGAAAGGAGAAAGGTTSNQAPPIYSSFESQSSMNFTSLSAVPLLRTPNDERSSTLSGSSRQLTDSASSVLNDQLLGTVVLSELGGLLGHGFKEVASLLIATSEDGHIRFFDSNSANTLRILKDIATGAAITCSAVSPDRKYLLTGNQMGQVSMWHLPSIVSSVAMEMKKNSANKHSNNNPNSNGKANPCAAAIPAAEGAEEEEEAETDPVKLAAKEKEQQAEREELEVLKAFGRYALQEINFANDYSAIRSIAIEPLARWAAVATNAGKVHFIRLARDKSVHGSKAGLASTGTGAAQLRAAAAAAAAAMHSKNGQLTPRDGQRPTSVGNTPQLSPQKSNANSMADSLSGTPSSRLALTGKAGSYTEGGISNSYHGPRETIYRSALVVSELSANARRTSGAGEEGVGGEINLNAMRNSGATIHNSIGAVLLDHLEQQQNSVNSRSNQAAPRQVLENAGLHAQLVEQSAAVQLAEALEMEVFDTIQAHYKYILRVLISPNAELLMTCSADYSIGRFVIPAALRLSASPSGSMNAFDKTTGSKAGSADAGKGSPPRNTAAAAVASSATGHGEEEETRTDTFSPSFASTQGPQKSTPGDQPVDASQRRAGGGADAAPTTDDAASTAAAAAATAAAGNSAGAKKAKVTATDSNSINSLGQSFDGTTGQTPKEAAATAEPPMDFKPLKPLTGHHRWVWDGVFSDCSNFLFTASSDNTVRMWNGLTTERPQSVGFVGHTKPVVAVLLCYDRRRLNAGSPAS